ncbi:MAG: DUF6531 domain-containing protein, partial [Desulfobulbaceae bacterium]|nr:DUF6531 domain-containing protein [Desulfobulbaceae bacterium]
MSNMQPAAREGDPIGHTPLLGMIAKVGAGILTGLAVGMAVGAIGLGVAFLTVGTGGIAGVVVGAVVGSIVNQWLDEKTNSITGSNKGLIGFLTDKACAAIDSVIPKEVSGEIVSGSRNVLINNRQAALTGDSGKVACGKHSPLPEAAEGSSRVYINNHLCHRKGDKVCCGGVTMAGSPNVLVGGDSKAECEIADELPWYLQYISKYAGMAIALCTSKGKLLQKVMCLGVNFAISAGADALVHGVWAGMKSAFGGHPVLAATGGKFLDGADDTDFSIAARLAIVWKRTYNSLDKRDDGLFGPGWSTAYGVQLRLHQEGEHPSVYIDERGREVFFPALRPGESAWNASYLCRLAYTPAGDFIVEGADGLYRDFGKPLSAGAHTLNLERLEDRNGNWLSLYFSEAGMLERMADSCGHPLRFVADAKHEGRVAAIETSSPGHEATAAWRTLVSYSYDASGRLATVTNALSHTTRRFSYHDDGPGKDLMASQTLPSGLTCHYQWAMFDHPRVVHTRHSDGRFWAASYDIEKGITRVEDDLGREEEWTWDGDFNPLSHTDALGQVTRLGWNADKQPVSLVKPNGAAWAYEYDEEGLLTKVIDPLGGVATTAWDHLLMQPLVESNAAGQESRYDYDKLGNLIRVTDAAGGVTEYGLDGYGQVCAITDPLDNIIRLVWNEEGRLARHIDCSGGETVYAYDAFGHLAVVTDAEGQASRYVNDALGRVTTLTTPDGGQRGIEWDAAGQMAAFTDALGHTSRYAYNQRGQLSQVTNAIGQGRSYSYDDAGNLYTLGNENGEEYVFRHDALDRRVAQAGLDGLRTEWSLDANGLPVLTRQAADREGEIRTVLTRDVLGRLIRKTTAETRTDYSYDPLGWVTRISRAGLDGAAIDDIAFAYDALGNLIEEKTTANGKSRSLKHSYDPLGNRVQTILPDGRVLSFSFCGTGFLGQVATAEREGDLETVISAIERDQLHRETLRGQGKRQARSSWDPLSRLSQRRSALRLNIGDILPGIDEVVPDIKKEFTYDHNGELSHRIDS